VKISRHTAMAKGPGVPTTSHIFALMTNIEIILKMYGRCNPFKEIISQLHIYSLYISKGENARQ